MVGVRLTDFVKLFLKYLILMAAEVGFLWYVQTSITLGIDQIEPLLLALVVVMKFLAVSYAFYGVSLFGQRVVSTTRLSLLKALLSRSSELSRADLQPNTARFMDELIRQTQFAGVSVLEPVVRAALDVCVLAVILLYALFLAPIVTLTVGAGVILVVGLYEVVATHLVPKFGHRYQRSSILVSQWVHALVNNSLPIRLARCALKYSEILEPQNQSIETNYAAGATWSASSRYILEFAIFLSVGLVLWLSTENGPYSSINVMDQLLVLGLVGLRAIPLFNSVLTARNQWRFGRRIVLRFIATMKATAAKPEYGHFDKVSVERPTRLSFSCNIIDSYKKLEGCVELGLPLVICGPSGVGKTSLLGALLTGRAYRTCLERLVIAGSATDELSLTSLSMLQGVGLMSQDSRLLPETLESNVSFGSNDQSLISIEDLATLLGLEKLALGDSSGWADQFYDPEKTSLSGGQRQRIAIARAFYQSSGVVILDEPTSALDRNSAAEISDAISKLADKFLVLIVSHDPSVLGRFGNHLDMM